MSSGRSSRTPTAIASPQSADREEVHEAGDAFYVDGGHLQRAAAGTEYLQFSPVDELKVVEEVLMRNVQAMTGG